MASIKYKYSRPIKNSDLLPDIVSIFFPQVPDESSLPTVQVAPNEIPEGGFSGKQIGLDSKRRDLLPMRSVR